MNATRAIAFLVASHLLAGCAAVMASVGEGWSRGQPRVYVEERIGPPITTTRGTEGTQIVVYEYERRRPSGEWAGFHAAMSQVTLGLWDIFGMPIEAVRGALQRERVRLTVSYGADDRVIEVLEEATLPEAR